MSALDQRGTAYRDDALARRPGGDFAAALRLYGRAIQVDPKASLPRIRTGWTYHLMGQETRAISETLAAIAVNPQNGTERFNLAVLRLYAGDYDQARKDYATAVTVARKLDSAAAAAAFSGALSDLNAFKQSHPEATAIADEMIALVQARGGS